MKTATAATLALLALASTGACATSRQPGARAPERPTALAIPERDPANQGTPRERPLVTGIEQATTAASVDTQGRPLLVRVLAPELTPAGAEDVRRAFPECAWAPPPEWTGFTARMATVRVRALEPSR